MSHIQGSDYVGSMVVMEDGLPKKSDYRRFKVRSVPGNDDFAAMEEVLTRRLSVYLAERSQPVGERSGEFSYPPQLLLVDGGKGQLNVAVRVLEELGLDEEIPVASLAKRFEEVYVPGEADPVRVPRGSEALYMLQRIRERGPPLRHHLPPPAARQAHDEVGARRHQGPRPDPAQAPDEGARGRGGGEGRVARRPPGPVLAARRRGLRGVREDPRRAGRPGDGS